MNNITLRGFLRDIEYSHSIGGTIYEKANIICPSTVSGKDDDIVSICYKKYVNKYKENDFVELQGNLRSYSTTKEGKNNVKIYVFTYFDTPETISQNNVEIDGRICLTKGLRHTKSGVEYLHFTLANNIFIPDGKKINNYIPCTCYGNLAKLLSNYKVNDIITIQGEFHSHCYKKYLDKSNDIFEYRIAHEVIVKDIGDSIEQ